MDPSSEEVKGKDFGVKMIEGNDKATKFYTGLTSFALFTYLFMFLSPYAMDSTHLHSISWDNQFFLVLVRLRLNLCQDLADRFGVSLNTVSKILDLWLDVMYYRLKFLIAWPLKDVAQMNMPVTFKELYSRCKCIIDCSEVFIDMPLNFEARSATFSNYKKHNTIKFLIAISPCGAISFLSECWGGRVSDKVLVQESGFLPLLEHGDVVLADRGFTITEDVAVFGAKLEIPPFTRGKKQLSQREVESSQQLSRVRIHVERVIGNLKEKYTILKGPLPINVLKHTNDDNIANIDKILVVEHLQIFRLQLFNNKFTF